MIHVGDKYGRLTVVRSVPERMDYWLCRCVCDVTSEVSAGNLRGGNVQSCGCLQRERVREMNTTHGHTVGETHTAQYEYWLEVRKSIHDPTRDSYKTFGGRGIKMLRAWDESFEAFLAGVGTCPEAGWVLRRKDANKDFVPGNMHWVPPERAALGKSDRVDVTIDGVTKQMNEWCKEYGIRKNTMHYRLKAGWSGTDLLKSGRNS